jgi:hypothetical protein
VKLKIKPFHFCFYLSYVYNHSPWKFPCFAFAQRKNILPTLEKNNHISKSSSLVLIIMFM